MIKKMKWNHVHQTSIRFDKSLFFFSFFLGHVKLIHHNNFNFEYLNLDDTMMRWLPNGMYMMDFENIFFLVAVDVYFFHTRQHRWFRNRFIRKIQNSDQIIKRGKKWSENLISLFECVCVCDSKLDNKIYNFSK